MKLRYTKGTKMKASLSDYLACAAWSSTDEYGDSMDSLVFSTAAHARMGKDLVDFVEYCEANLPTTLAMYELTETAKQFAHDFWLTRNGHGAGFWDRGLGVVGDRLTKVAKSFGSCDLYVNHETSEIEVQ
jgi:hypothetical protein